MHNKE